MAVVFILASCVGLFAIWCLVDALEPPRDPD